MLHSTLRSSFVAAFAAALIGCNDGTPLSPEPTEEPTVVFTESVVARIDGTINDASTRILVGLADVSYAAQLAANLDELNRQLAAGSLAEAEATVARTRAMIERSGVSQEVLDFAHDLSAVGLILDHTEILLDQAAGRS